MRYFLAGLLLLSTLAPLQAWADCRVEGQQALTLLMDFKQSALNNGSMDKNQFQSQFSGLISQMKQEGCMTELMGLMTVIQREQQQYPAPSQTAQAH